jgi:hypothetical protein
MLSAFISDFLYERKNDVMESPYFSKIYDFGQDVDKLYKDIMKNDIITNIRKYSKILYDFIREKYFTMVPFGKNLTNIIPQAMLCFWKGLLFTVSSIDTFSSYVFIFSATHFLPCVESCVC